MLNIEGLLGNFTPLVTIGKTAKIQAVQGVASTVQGAYYAYVTKPHGATTKKCDVHTSF